MREFAARLVRSTLIQDALLAVFITAMQVQGVRQAADGSEVAARSLGAFGDLGYVLLALSGLVLVARRLYPTTVFVVTALISMLYFSLNFPDGPGWIALFVATYTLTAHGDGRRSLVIAGVGIATLAAVWLVADADIEPRAAIGWVFFRIGASIMSAALGESARSRRVIAAEAQERADRAERTREEEARARVDAERLRIAREVHDTVAHSIAIINVQAGVTAHVLDKRPERARETLVAIEHTSSAALQEMRAILGVLRDENDGRVPHPGLGQIDELIAKARAADLDVECGGDPAGTEVPTAVGSAAYRIVQESFTNVIRHVGPTRVVVLVERTPDHLDVSVTNGPHRHDRGRVRPADDRDGEGTEGGLGHGIAGMRERCELLGGELDAGPTRDGGFEVRARLPLAPVGAVPA